MIVGQVVEHIPSTKKAPAHYVDNKKFFELREGSRRPIRINPCRLLTRGTGGINYKKTFPGNPGLLASLINMLPQEKAVFVFRGTLIGFILRGVTIFIFNIVIYFNRHVPIIGYTLLNVKSSFVRNVFFLRFFDRSLININVIYMLSHHFYQ